MLVRQVGIRNAVGTSAYRRRSAAAIARVMLWRTFVTLLVMALPVAVIVLDEPRYTSHERDAYHLVQRYAHEAFPQWATSVPWRHCPDTLDELAEFAGAKPIDPWGTPLAMNCGSPIRGVFVSSAGPDQRFNTDDDITSNTVR